MAAASAEFAERRPALPGLNRSLPDVVHDAAVGLVGVGGVRDRVGMRTRTSGRPLRLPRPARAATAVAGMGAAVLDLLLPSSCAACGRLGAAACEGCLAGLGRGPVVVRPGVAALSEHAGAARELVLAYKERGRRELAAPLGRALGRVVPTLAQARPDSGGTWWLVPVPSRPSASRVRGGPHVTALARWCAAELAERGQAAAVAPALRLSGRVRDAVGLGRAERVANLSGRVGVVPAGVPAPGTPVVLLDDVVTTGATLDACARALSRAGVRVRAALTLTAAPAPRRS